MLDFWLLIYWSIYFPNLTYGHKLWVMSERKRLWTQVAKNEFSLQGGWALQGEKLNYLGGTQNRATAPPHWEEPDKVALRYG